jgi:hypothetical protein
MKFSINQFLFAFVASMLLASCASLTGFEEGKTLGADNSEFGISANYIRAPNLFEDELEADSLVGIVGFPNIELNYKYGITEKIDVGAKVSTNFNSSAYAKYQLVGDKSSKFALSPGFEVGTILGAAYSIGVPVYASYYPTPNFAINVNPRFMYQSITGDISSGATYLGGNLGLMFGKKHKFGLDFGFYNVGSGGTSNNLITFGLGGKFRFGDFDNSSSRFDDEESDSRRSNRSKKRRKRN